MWQYTLTVQENELKFDSIGKASTLDENLFAEVWDPLDPPLPLGTPNGTFPASDYPEFYQSILSQDGADSATTTSIITPTTTSISTPTITSISTTITTSSGPSPTPSQAIVIYLREVCPPQPRAICRSFAWEYNITPGQSVDVCAQTPDYTQMYSIAFSNAISNGDTDYSISVGPFDISETVTGCYYNATEPVPGELTCVGLKQPCFGNLVKPTTCGVATNTQIAYAEW